MNYQQLHTIKDFSDEWNSLSENYFQRTDFLLHLEKFNPCKQRYYVCEENQKIVAAAVIYSLPVNIFSFAGIKSMIQMQIIGIPCSVSSSGMFGSDAGIQSLSEYIFSTEKGFVLMLNLKDKPKQQKYATGRTLPTVVIDNRFSDWNEFLEALTAPYRRRLNKLMKDTGNMTFSTLSPADFSSSMYRLYENVYEKSNAKLEKLTLDFFINLPQEFQIFTCSHNDKVVGWNIGIQDGNTFYFFLGGIDYQMNKTHNVYLRLLAGLVKSGIERKCRFIDLGQTAEIAKMRMGGELQTLYMQALHSNSLLNSMLKMAKPLLEYNRKTEDNNIFKTTTR